ncbi:hypothetical protein GCM10029964_050750 [Kibdelosporangium lantanae]
MRRLSLRTRLVVTVGALVLVGMIPLAFATSGALQDWRTSHDNDTLTSTSRALAQDLANGATLTNTPLAAALTVNGDVPSFFQLRRTDGTVLRTVGTEATTGWITHTEPVGTDRVLVVGMRTDVSDRLLGRITRVVTFPSLFAFTGVLVLSVWLVRRELRPLDRIARTAQAIGDGDLTQRVDPADPRTEVGRLSGALNGMLGQLETAFDQRSASEQRLRTFLADASHELRTPVATIRAYAELFRRGAADRPADLTRVTGRIESEAERMGVLVDEMLLLARLDQGRPLDRELTDLNALAADAIAAARATEPDRPLHLETPPDPVLLTCDPTRIRQVLDNLLANVRTHTSRHGGDPDRGHRRRNGHSGRHGHRPGHPGRRPPARVRPLLPRRPHPYRRHGPGPVPGGRHRPGPPRHGVRVPGTRWHGHADPHRTTT